MEGGGGGGGGRSSVVHCSAIFVSIGERSRLWSVQHHSCSTACGSPTPTPCHTNAPIIFQSSGPPGECHV